MLCELYRVRDFQLLLCADVWDRVGEYSVQVLKEAVAVGGVKGMFDGFSSKPVVIHSPRVIPRAFEKNFISEPKIYFFK